MDLLNAHKCIPLCGVLGEDIHVIQLDADDNWDEEAIKSQWAGSCKEIIALKLEADIKPLNTGVTVDDRSIHISSENMKRRRSWLLTFR